MCLFPSNEEMKPTSKTWQGAPASSTGGGLHGAIHILPFYIDPLISGTDLQNGLALG